MDNTNTKRKTDIRFDFNPGFIQTRRINNPRHFDKLNDRAINRCSNLKSNITTYPQNVYNINYNLLYLFLLIIIAI